MKWNLQYTNPFSVINFKKNLNINNILSKILINRGINLSTAKAILNNPLELLESPYDIYGAEDVAEEIIELSSDEKQVEFWVFADYDVDGLTAGYVMKTFLSLALKLNVEVYYPSRSEGYGLNMNFCKDIVNKAKIDKDKKIVVITVDNGITKIDEVQYLKHNNIDIIVTDHHEPKINGEIPLANAICDAFLSNKSSGKHLCGATIAWKICSIIEDKLKLDTGIIEALLPYISLATVADVMPMTPENIALVNLGLDIINNNNAPRLNMILQHTGVKKATYKDLGWNIAPKLNSCSRMDNIELAQDFFEAPDLDSINDVVLEILELDEARKSLVKKAVEQAEKEDYEKDSVCIFDTSEYGQGIAGIIAGKLAEKYNKPAITISKNEIDNSYTGSVRSIAGINIFQSLCKEKANDNLIDCGGHAEAAGLKLAEDKLSGFKESINKEISSIFKELDIDINEKSIQIDTDINLSDINNETLDSINLIPYDNLNFKAPLFLIKNLTVTNTRTSNNNPNNICFTLKDDNDLKQEMWGWGLADKYKSLNNPLKIDVIGKLDIGFGKNANQAVFVITDLKESA